MYESLNAVIYFAVLFDVETPFGRVNFVARERVNFELLYIGCKHLTRALSRKYD